MNPFKKSKRLAPHLGGLALACAVSACVGSPTPVHIHFENHLAEPQTVGVTEVLNSFPEVTPHVMDAWSVKPGASDFDISVCLREPMWLGAGSRSLHLSRQQGKKTGSTPGVTFHVEIGGQTSTSSLLLEADPKFELSALEKKLIQASKEWAQKNGGAAKLGCSPDRVMIYLTQ